jgi:hypothetical protein
MTGTGRRGRDARADESAAGQRRDALPRCRFLVLQVPERWPPPARRLAEPRRARFRGRVIELK